VNVLHRFDIAESLDHFMKFSIHDTLNLECYNSNPSVTWPNHTTLMTGVCPEALGVIFNGLPERQGVGKPVKLTYGGSQKELVRVRLLFDVLKTAGKSSAAINRPCTRDSVSIDDSFPDVPDDPKALAPAESR
jgi:Type I phosphodiesterase / nucleotide pyrophosphatase